MTRSPAGDSTSIRDRLLGDCASRELCFDELLTRLEAKAHDDVSRIWSQLATSLLAHMSIEETCIIPSLLAASGRDARVIMGEHRHIRSRIDELSACVQGSTLALGAARTFLAELRAHTRSKDRVLYAWAEQHLAATDRQALLDALDAHIEPVVRTG